MTNEECIGLLKRYAEYNGMGIPNLAGCREAMRMAAELLERPSLPSNLDEAAEEFTRSEYSSPCAFGGENIEEWVSRIFKAGAEWQYQKDRAEFAKLKAKEWQEGFDIGKAEALKDLPRWRKATGKERFNERMIVFVEHNYLWCTNYAEEGEYYLPLSDLEKLPKED